MKVEFRKLSEIKPYENNPRHNVACDYYDNMPPSGVLAARNVAWDLAESLGWSHFLVLDDDYFNFARRLWRNSSTKWVVRGPFAGFGTINEAFDVLTFIPKSSKSYS